MTTVEIFEYEVLTYDGKWPEYWLCCTINNKLKNANAPYVDDIFLSPESWQEKIMRLYSRVESYPAIANQSVVYKFYE